MDNIFDMDHPFTSKNKAPRMGDHLLISGWIEAFRAIQSEYDKLCPKPSEFGIRSATECWALYPIRTLDCSYLRFNNGNSKGTELDIDKIPLGIDYRLCRWSIEDAKRIWGEE